MLKMEAKNEAVIQLWEYNGTAAQKFYLIDTSLGDFTIHSAIDPKYVLDVKNGENKDGNIIQLYTLNLSLAQRFKLIEP